MPPGGRKQQKQPSAGGGSTRIIGGRGMATDNSADFHAAFSAQFLGRYADLFQALAAPMQHVALLNAFTTVNDCDELGITQRVSQVGPITCYRFPEPPATYPPPTSCPYTQLKQWYWLDFASMLPPLLLGVAPHHVVLDMCAAPGGKSLVLAMQLLLGQEQGQTVLDECADTDDARAEAGVSDDGSSPRRPAAAAGQERGLTHEWLQQLDLNAGTQAGAVPHHQQQQQELSQAPAPAAAAAGVNGLQQQPQQDSSGSPAGSNQAATAGAGQQVMGEQEEAEGKQAEEDEQEEEDWPPPAAVNSTSSTPGRLVCNELHPVRRQRLSGVLATYLPGSLRRRVRVTGHDAAHHWARFEGGLYDRVLLDAPCSSERHVVAAALEAGGVISSSSWSREQCANLAALQLKLLLAGLRALKPGGRLVYSTCSMAAVENDGVVQQALSLSKGGVSAVPLAEWGVVGSAHFMELSGAEATQHGMLCLPDKAGCGPIYLCLLQKQHK